MRLINVEVHKNPNENPTSTIRRFSKRVQGAGVLSRARRSQFYSRPLSRAGQKIQALKRIRRGKERERLKKLGKIPG